MPLSMLKLIILFFLFLPSLGAQSFKVKVGAQSAILFNPENGAILFQKKPHAPHPPASLTKIPTALLLLDEKRVDLTEQIVASDEATRVIYAPLKQAEPEKFPAYLLEHDGIFLGLLRGERHTYHALLHALMLTSGNDIANVLAEKSSGSIPSFMKDLNHYLKQKGVVHSHFENPHGLFHPRQVTTAFEMAQITALALANPTFCEIVKKSSFELPPSNLQEGRMLVSANKLLTAGKYHYPKAIGVKTGYTSGSGFHLVAAATHEGRTLIAVLLGYFEDANQRFKDAIALFETAFREKPLKRLLFTQEFDHFSKKMPKAKQVLKAALSKDVEIKYFPSEESELKAQIVWTDSRLPVQVGQDIGKLMIRDERDNLITTCPLYALGRVEKKLFYIFWDFFRENAILTLIALGYFICRLLRKRRAARR